LSGLSYLDAVLVGLIQGVAEWLPISSKTMVMLYSLIVLGGSAATAYALGLALQGSTVLAAMLYFWRDLAEVLRFRNVKMLLFLLITTMATGVSGVPIYLALRCALGSSDVAVNLISIFIGAILMAQAVLLSRLSPGTKGIGDISFRDSVILGLSQGLAAIPGISRSGITLATLLFLRYRVEDALRLSFLASIPANLGATLLVAIEDGGLGMLSALHALIALLVSAATGFAAIGTLIKIARRHGYKLTAALGMLTLAVGVISTTFLGL